MEKILVRVTGGPFVGFTGELVDGSVTINISGSLYNIGCPAYAVLNAPVPAPIAYDFDRKFCAIKK